MGFSFSHGTQKRWIMAALWRLPLFKFGDNPQKSILYQTCKTFPTVYMVAPLKKKLILSRVITKSLSRPRTSQKNKTAIITPFGLFEYLFTPFGLSNADQRMMDRTTDGLEGVFAYMDNSHVGSLDRQTHLCHLEAFFTALAPMASHQFGKMCFCNSFSGNSWT
jgi:hypothetical protein